MLFPIQNHWEMAFVTSGKQALELLDQSEFDLLITDIRMPEMTGIQLLHEVVSRHPQIIRIVLSGTADQEMTLRSATLAHQYLVKPCDAEILRGTIERAFSFSVMLDQPALKQLVSSVSTLPSVPSSYGKLIQVLRDPDVPLKEIGRIIANDVGMSAKILQLVNSSFFALRRHIGNPTEAVFYLGLETVKALALTVSAFSKFEIHGRFSVEDLQNHSLRVGALARGMAVAMKLPKSVIDDCFTAGLLHDVGKLILSAYYSEVYDRALNLSREHDLPQVDAETQVLGASHAAIGGYLLWLWGLPDPVIEAVVRHHETSDVPPPARDPAYIVRTANALILEGQKGDPDACPSDPANQSDGDFASWRNLANKILTEDT
jgi:putative nucleotidyltransferase with HDIG domain